MANIQYGELIQEAAKNSSIIPFENENALTRRTTAEDLANGSLVVLVRSLTDLPAPTNGFIQLEQEKSYRIIEPFTITSPILFPAGYKGYFESSFLSSDFIIFDVTPAAAFNTLNLDGTIDSIANAGGGFITVTSTAHGIENGQYVNITGTTSYNLQQLLVSNVTANTFDVELAFVADESGLFNTGFETILIRNIDLLRTIGSVDVLSLTSSGSITSIAVLRDVLAAGFVSPGIIQNTAGVQLTNVLFSYGTTGLTLDNVGSTDIDTVQFVDIGLLPTSRGLTISGAATFRVTIDGVDFVMSDNDQRPMLIDSNIVNANLVSITNSPDNGVADEYFDTTGLDQTDPIVLTKNNGVRLDSMARAQVGFTNVITPIVVSIVTQDVPVLIAGTQFVNSGLERATANTAGQITNLTKRPKVYPVTFSGLIEKAGGGSTDIGILIIKNGSLVLTDTFEIPHSVNAGIIQISATRDFELAESDTIELAVVNFDGTADINVTQANITYAVES